MVLVAELRTNFCIRSLRLVKVLAVLLLLMARPGQTRGGLVPDRHVEHCRWAEQRAMAHQDERWGGLAMQYGGLFMG